MPSSTQPFNLSVWQSVLNTLPNPVTLNKRSLDEDGEYQDCIVFVNDAFKDAIGYSPEEIPTVARWFKIAYPDPAYQEFISQSWFKAVENAKGGKSTLLGFPARVACKDGSERWFQITSHLDYTIEDEYHIIVFVEVDDPGMAILNLQDTTADLIRNHRQLQASELLLKEIQSIAQIGSWEIDIESQVAEWSDEMFNIFGQDPASYQPTMEAFFEKLSFEEDRINTQFAIEQAIATGEKQEVIVRVVRPDGVTVHLQIYGQAEFDEAGKAVRILGSCLDISDSVQSQISLKNQYQLLEKIIDSVPVRVFWVDADSVYLGANNLFLQDAQLASKEELIGKTDLDLIWSKEDTTSYREDDLIIMQSGLPKLHYEYTQMTDDGQEIIWLSSRVPIKDVTGIVIGMVCIYEDITERRSTEVALEKQKDSLHHQAHHDALTSLPNRISFNNHLNEAIRQGQHNGRQFALLFIDLDQFKQVNDSLGHDVGDRVLQTVADKLKAMMSPEDSLARLGGDEFTILLQSLSSPRDISSFAQKVLEEVIQAIIIDEHTFYLSCSVGISLYPDDSVSADELLKFADTAMYRAKDQGRNNFQFYTADMTLAAFEHIAMQSSLHQAIKNHEFVVYYQPQVNALTNEVTGMEALVRWQHPSLGLVGPNRFIPIAEETGLIVALDRLVMKAAMRQMSEWVGQGYQAGVLSINLAVKQIQQPDFMPFVISTLAETKCLPQWISFEVTESDVMKNLDEINAKLKEIQSLGIKISIDDFGTGYSSLAYLKRLPINKLKIDRSFIKDLPIDEEDVTITKIIIMMAKNLGLEVIAEGVENTEQRDFLIENGCPHIQGFLYGKPMPSDEVIKFLSEFYQ